MLKRTAIKLSLIPLAKKGGNAVLNYLTFGVTKGVVLVLFWVAFFFPSFSFFSQSKLRSSTSGNYQYFFFFFFSFRSAALTT